MSDPEATALIGAKEHADALVREYLARRGLRQTLATMDAEAPRTEHAITSSSAVSRGLKLERLVKRNKEREAPLASLLELVCEALVLNEKPLRVDAGAAAVAGVAQHLLTAAAITRRGPVVEQDGLKAEQQPNVRPEAGAGAPPPAAPARGSAAGSWGGADTAFAERERRAKALASTMLVEEEVGDEDGYGSFGAGAAGVGHRGANGPQPTVSATGAPAMPPGVRPRELGTSAAAGLSELFHGRANAEWMASWVRQGFGFSEVAALPFALKQHRGGTCGVIAAIQALLIRELLEASPPVDPLRATHAQRERALVRALAGALWRITQHAGGARPRAALVLFPNRMVLPAPREVGREASVLALDSRAELEQCIAAHLADLQRADGAGVIAFAYSCVLSAGGPEAVRAQMDSTGVGSSTLLGAHGYCTQELVNLVATGAALSNVFDGDKELDGMIMRGMSAQAPVGLLSLFEHYGHVAVGRHLKAPSAPVWIAFMESHYTVLYAPCPVAEPPAEPFDLVYYDMLANQDYIIRLTLDPRSAAPPRDGRDLVPPLEDTLHTKWPGVGISWNGADPLL